MTNFLKNLFIILILTGCAKEPTTEVNEAIVEPKEPDYVLVCTDENDEALRCEYDSDCCEGFVCVKEQNTRNTKVCVTDR